MIDILIATLKGLPFGLALIGCCVLIAFAIDRYGTVAMVMFLAVIVLVISFAIGISL